MANKDVLKRYIETLYSFINAIQNGWIGEKIPPPVFLL